VPHPSLAAPTRPRWVLLALCLAATLYGVPLLLDVPLLDPDEGLHAAIAREMVEAGDLVTPRLLGEPFLDKPVLFFWAQAASLRAFGVTETAVRLPGLLFGLLGTLTTAWLAWRMLGAAVGLLAGLFHATLLLPMALAQAAVHDVALVPWTNLAILFFWRAQERAGARPARGDTQAASPAGPVVALCAIAGLWLGLAVLTKGLSGVALVGVPLALYLLATRRLRRSLVAGGLTALAVMALVALPWYLAMERATPGYLHYFFVERHLLGYATATQLHGWRPWWYYLPVLAGGALPWIGAIVFARPPWPGRARSARSGPPEGGPHDSPSPQAHDRTPRRPESPLPPDGPHDRASPTPARAGALTFLWVWVAADVLFLSAAGSKLLTYLLPVFPAVAILCAAAWAQRLVVQEVDAGGRAAWFGAAARSHALAMALVLPALILVIHQRELPLRVAPAILLGALSVVWMLAAVWWGRTRPDAWLAGSLALVAVTFVAGMLLLVTLGPYFSAREMAAHFNRQGAVPTRLWVLDERIGSLLFYLDPEIRRGLEPGQVRRVTPDVVYSMRQPPHDTVIAIPVREMPAVSRRIDLDEAPYEPAGGYRLYDAAVVHAAIAARVGRRQ
jgi:4-amino-4-deoxy-L-arabinose transferase-like glycosyltransferase